MYRSVPINQSHGFCVSFKRTMFVVSLYFRLMDNRDPDDDELKQLNHHFYLVSNPCSLEFPALMGRWLWRDSTISAIRRYIKQGETTRAIELVYGKIPRMVRYLDRETMVQDANRVIARVMRDSNSSIA